VTDKEFLEHMAIKLVSDYGALSSDNMVLRLKAIALTLDEHQDTSVGFRLIPKSKLRDMQLLYDSLQEERAASIDIAGIKFNYTMLWEEEDYASVTTEEPLPERLFELILSEEEFIAFDTDIKNFCALLSEAEREYCDFDSNMIIN